MATDRVRAIAALLLAAYVVAPATTYGVEPLPSFDRVRVLTTGRAIDDAELVDQDAEPFLLSELRGRVALIFFGFTHCPDVCPTTMTHWRMLAESGAVDLDQVAFVLISVDGERDTPAVMKTYLQGFSEHFLGLTAPPQTVKPIAKQFAAAFYKENPAANGGHYNVTHSPQAYVVDTSGTLRAEFYNPSVEAMAGTINALLAESAGEGKSGP